MITRKLMFAIALLVAVPRVASAQEGGDDKAPKQDENAGKDQPADKAPTPAPPAPKAPTADDLEKAKQAYIEGKRLIEDEHDIQGGVAKFKESYRLSRNPLLLYNIGFALDSLKDTEGALIYYKKFLSDTSDDAPNRDLAAARIKQLDRQADADAMFSGSAPGTEKSSDTTGSDTTEAPAKAPPPPAPKHQVTEFEHRVVDSAPPGKPLDLSAFVPDASHWQLTLFYRVAGTSNYQSTPMRPRYNELVGRIPASAMHGNTIQYYIEARDRQDKVVGRSGHATSPNLVFIDPSAKPQFYPDIEGGDTVDNTANSGNGGGAMLGHNAGPNGPSDQPRNLETYARWGTTAGAGAFMTMALTFYFIASDANSGLEGEAFSSNNENCPMGPPCRSFSDAQKSLQSRGQTFETLTNVMLISGAVAAGAAGYLWYREYQRKKERARTPAHRVVLTPAVGPGYVGGAAALRF